MKRMSLNGRGAALLPAVAFFLGVAGVVALEPSFARESRPPTTRVRVVFSVGHETDRRDRGRPVALIAAALGVPPQVFRDAFSRVRPAPAGTEPDPEQVRRNKDALLSALGPYGVTNERLDEVSNYYRYRPGRGNLWPTEAAVAYALVRDGRITGFVVERGGSGYSSPPRVSVPGFGGVRAQAQLAFGKAFRMNGSVSGIRLINPKSAKG